MQPSQVHLTPAFRRPGAGRGQGRGVQGRSACQLERYSQHVVVQHPLTRVGVCGAQSTEHQLADLLTKPLQLGSFERCLYSLLGEDPPRRDDRNLLED